MRLSAWTDDRIDLLRKLAADGLSAGMIGYELRVSRNAVIGKLHRLGLAPIGKKVMARPRKPPTIKTRRHGFNRPRVLALALAEAPIIDLPPDESPDACTIAQLTAESCRWPLNDPTRDMLYCGAQKLDCSSYCARHARIAYRPVGRAE